MDTTFVDLPGVWGNRNDFVDQGQIPNELKRISEEIRGEKIQRSRIAAAGPYGGFENCRIDSPAFQSESTGEAGQSATNDGHALHVLAFARARILSRRNRVRTLSTSEGATAFAHTKK